MSDLADNTESLGNAARHSLTRVSLHRLGHHICWPLIVDRLHLQMRS